MRLAGSSSVDSAGMMKWNLEFDTGWFCHPAEQQQGRQRAGLSAADAAGTFEVFQQCCCGCCGRMGPAHACAGVWVRSSNKGPWAVGSHARPLLLLACCRNNSTAVICCLKQAGALAAHPCICTGRRQQYPCH
jgi:hypothetical protein